YKTQAIISATIRRLHPGAVILLHDGHEHPPAGGINQSSTVEALPAIIKVVSQAGLTFASIEKMIP
ncbi:MAG TPA: hypothetical protein VGW37_15340, partial [Terriglobia bacterium]|nr:hypothetical protein [Terriglobia bacterium]